MESMETQVNELLKAWRICKDGSVRDPKIHENAFNHIENFKQNSPNLLDVGFYLAYQKESFEITYFGLQLITHTIKFRWNNFADHLKSEVKQRLMGIIVNLDDNRNAKGPYYVKNCMCLVIIELIKREWPQNWPSLITDLFEISRKSSEHKKLIFVIFKYMAEEFIESEAMTTQLPAQRRKDINQYLNQNMESIFFFYLDTLDYCYATLNKNDPAELNAEFYDLANNCLDSLSNYINWININYISARNYSIINICLALLNDEKVCKNSAKCLAGLANRKGDASERKPLMGLFSESVLFQLVNSIKCSMASQNFKDLVKYLVEILTGMGQQLNYLWNSADFVKNGEKPACLNIYLEAIYQLIFLENRIYSSEAVQTLSILLQNEFICVDPDIQQILVTLSHALTNSFILFKFNYMSMIDHFDTEEDFNKFCIKYRNDMSKCIRLASSLNFDVYLHNAYEWSLKVLHETNKLDPNDQSGFDPNSLLYLHWDALIVMWNNLVSVLNKKLYTHESIPIEMIKTKLINLLSTSIQFCFKNPNFNSFNLSFISCILTKTSDLYDQASKEMMLKTIVDKLINDFVLFQNESVSFQGMPTHAKYFFNLRRQITAVLLNICKSFNKHLVKSFDYFYAKFMELINLANSTQMEKCILIQGLVLLSNEFGNAAMQIDLLKQFVTPILEFLQVNNFYLANMESFIQFLGLDSETNTANNNAACVLNRKLIFFYVNCLSGILKCVTFITDGSVQQQQLNNYLSHAQSSMFIQLFEYLMQLLKAFNLLHTANYRQKVNRDLLDMTDSARLMVLGMQQIEKHATNLNSAEVVASHSDNPEKIIMFMYNTYDTLNQVLSLYMMKFKNELLLTEVSPHNMEFIYRFGEAIFSGFNDLPTFRIRSLIRYTLKTCMTVLAFDRALLTKNYTLLKLNQVILEYFLPAILARVNDLNKYYINLKASDALDGEADKENDDQDELLNTQIIEENQFILLCRDVIDFVRVFVLQSSMPGKEAVTASSNGDEPNEVNENIEDIGEMMENNTNAGRECANPHQINELAVYLMKTSKIIYQSTLLCLFAGLNWSDSLSCAKLSRVSLSLFENFPITNQSILNPTIDSPFSICINEQIADQIFKSCLTSLQIHGEHQEIQGLLLGLTYVVYDKSMDMYKQSYNKVLIQIPNLNKKLFEDFLHKCAQSAQQQAINQQPNGHLEKMKKDMFKRLIQPIIGKNLGQLYKNEIKIRVLEPLNMNSKRKANDTAESNGVEFNICSLFDPNH